VTALGTHNAFNVFIWRYVMKRFLGFCFAMFIALVAIALVGGDSGAVAGHGCKGRARCNGGLLGHKKSCKGGLFAHKKKRCKGEEAAAPACESGCGEAAEAASDCGSCGGESAAVEGGCSSCGGEAVSSGCVGGGCEGSGVISEGVPTEAAPVAPAAPAKT
jgi:hypothetical protein